MGNIFRRKSKHARLDGEDTVSEFHGVPVENQSQSEDYDYASDNGRNEIRGTGSTAFVANNLYYSEVDLEQIQLPTQCNERSRLTTQYKVVVAIDFGTSFTGYAYSYKDSPNKIYLNDNWGAEFGMASYKAPTCVCLDGLKKSHGFGYTAHKNYEDNSLYMYKKFKMQLHEKREHISSGLKITSDEGKEIDAKTIFAEALKYLKDHFLKVTERAGRRIGNVDDVLWVLTVPAIWSDHEKMFMREAAVQAGLVSNGLSDRLLIALEPEAASFYCRTFYSEMAELQPGHKYMVIDAGGGTVDIAVHKIKSDGSCVEIHEPSGGLWGGDRINEGVERMIAEVLGNDFLNSYKRKYRWNWFQLLYNFETQKAGYHDFNKPITLPLGITFHECYQEMKGQSLKDALKNTENQGLSLNRNQDLQIGGKQLRELYDQEINKIIKHIQCLLNKQNCADIDAMMLVGGFGRCDRLYSSIKETFSQKHVLQPEEANLAVLRGAVLFAHRPDFIRTRISPCTYAVLHHTDLPQSNIDLQRVSGTFYRRLKPIIIKGEPVEINTIKEEYGIPAEDYMNIVEIELFSSNNHAETFDDNPEAKSNSKVGKVIVKCSSPSKDRLITILFIFGCTYIRVSVNTSDGEEAEADFGYL